MPINLPDDSNRQAIIGATGSGKTVAALHHLSMRSILQKPWIIYNFKDDENIDSIPGAYHIELDEVPTRPGVYVAHPAPESDDEQVEQQMAAIWLRGNTGVYIDEGYMVPRNNKAFGRILTQGRSRQIPVIVLSQRSAWMNRFVFSEAEFFRVFRLQHADDQKAVEKFVPVDLSVKLPKYWSWWYDVQEDKATRLSPSPNIDTIFGVFERRLMRRTKVV